MPARLRIAILTEQRYLAQAQPLGMSGALAAGGHDVTLIDPQVYEIGEGFGPDGFDLIVARGRSWPLLSLLAAAEACGKLTINPKSSIGAVHNKAEMASALAGGKVPIPRTFIGKTADLADRVPQSCYPLILKPIFGDNGRGLRIMDAPADLREFEWPEETAVAQEYLPNDGYDLKLYGIGDEIWAVRKISPLAKRSGFETKTELLPVTPRLRELGRRCGQLFGLDLYGVDCIETPRGPVVIEVNEFPNYTGVPDADQTLATYAVDCPRTRRHENRAIDA